MKHKEPVKRQPRALRADVHTVLLDRLTTNYWAPGDHLSIDGLARELSVSPTPVREAMVALERSGLIKYRAQRGYIAAPPLDSQQINHLIDARLVLERAALTRAFTKDWDNLVEELRTAQQAHSRAADLIRASQKMDYADLRKYFDADIQFHRALFAVADNEFLTASHESLGVHGHRLRQTWASGREHFDLDETLQEHLDILSRVQDRNHDGAMSALEVHLLNVRTRFSPTIA